MLETKKVEASESLPDPFANEMDVNQFSDTHLRSVYSKLIKIAFEKPDLTIKGLTYLTEHFLSRKAKILFVILQELEYTLLQCLALMTQDDEDLITSASDFVS
jgi:hypothetical protein